MRRLTALSAAGALGAALLTVAPATAEAKDRRGRVNLGASVGYRKAIDLPGPKTYRSLLERYGYGELTDLLELRATGALRVTRWLDLGVFGEYLFSSTDSAGLGGDGLWLHVLGGAAFVRPYLYRPEGNAASVSLELAAGVDYAMLSLRSQTLNAPMLALSPSLVLRTGDGQRLGAEFRAGYTHARWTVTDGYVMQVGGIGLSIGFFGWL